MRDSKRNFIVAVQSAIAAEFRRREIIADNLSKSRMELGLRVSLGF